MLCDTQAIVRWFADDLPVTAVRAIEKADEALVSVASLWEIAIKRATGKLTSPPDILERLGDGGFTVLAIAPAHALGVSELPLHHRDPFDRLLIVQAIDLRLVVVTGDAAFSAYGVATTW